jgi:hypothetical protein
MTTMESVQGWMNPEQTKEFYFSSGCCTYRQHVEQLRREEVCLLALMVSPQEIAGLQEAPGSLTGLHLV